MAKHSALYWLVFRAVPAEVWPYPCLLLANIISVLSAGLQGYYWPKLSWCLAWLLAEVSPIFDALSADILNCCRPKPGPHPLPSTDRSLTGISPATLAVVPITRGARARENLRHFYLPIRRHVRRRSRAHVPPSSAGTSTRAEWTSGGTVPKLPPRAACPGTSGPSGRRGRRRYSGH